MGPVLSANAAAIHQLEINLVHQFGGLKSDARALLSYVALGLPPQCLMDNGHQRVECRLIPLPHASGRHVISTGEVSIGNRSRKSIVPTNSSHRGFAHSHRTFQLAWSSAPSVFLARIGSITFVFLTVLTRDTAVPVRGPRNFGRRMIQAVPVT